MNECNESVFTTYDVKDEVYGNDQNDQVDMSFISKRREVSNLCGTGNEEMFMQNEINRNSVENTENRSGNKEEEMRKAARIFKKSFGGDAETLKIFNTEEGIEERQSITNVEKEDSSKDNKEKESLKIESNAKIEKNEKNEKNSTKNENKMKQTKSNANFASVKRTSTVVKPSQKTNTPAATNKNDRKLVKSNTVKVLSTSDAKKLIKPTTKPDLKASIKPPATTKASSKPTTKKVESSSSTKIVKKITPASAKLKKAPSLTEPTSTPFNQNLISFSEFLSEKMEDIFDTEFQTNFQLYLQKFVNLQKESEKEIESNSDELLNYIQFLYEEKINKINELNEKYEYDLPKLKDLADPDDPNNVNNIIFKSVLNDKESEMKEIEEEFKKKKEEGIAKIKSELSTKKSGMENLKLNQTEEIKSELTNGLRSRIMQCLTLEDQMKRVDLSCIDLRTNSNKKVDFNSTVNTTIFNNTTMPMEINTRKTISYKKK